MDCPCNQPQPSCPMPGVIEVEKPIMFRLVKIPSSVGDETAFPPNPGLYRNVLLHYDINEHTYIYSSDGMPVLLTVTAEGGEGTVKSVNNVEPDTAGNVALSPSDILSQAQLDAVNSGITASGVTKLGDLANIKSIGSNLTLNSSTGELSATDTTYTAGTGLSLTGTEFSVDTSTIQSKLTAGSNITITGDTISATDTTYSDFVGATSGVAGSAGLVPAPASGDTDKYLKSDGSWATVSSYTLPAASANTLGGVKIGSNLSMDSNDVLSATDTTYSNFVGTDGQTAGTAGLVPAPATTDAGKFLKADGTWDSAGSSVNVVQTTGTSTTDVMSQKAVANMIYPAGYESSRIRIAINGSVYGNDAVAIGGTANMQRAISIGTNSNGNAESVSIGYNATSAGQRYCVCIGANAMVTGTNLVGAIALGQNSNATSTGEMNIGSTNTSYGYNNSNYRLLTGVYDPQSAHDAATKGYADTKAVITMTSTDPGEGSPLDANHFIAYYE